MENIVGCRREPSAEAIINLLNKKKLDPDFPVQGINEIDIYKLEPFDLPGLSGSQSDELVWFFLYSPCQKHENGNGVNRRTRTGSWKVTSQRRQIFAKHGKQVIGTKCYLTFYEHFDDSTKHKTDWVMHEFHSEYDPPHEVETQQISGHPHMTNDFGNNFSENTFSRVEREELADMTSNHPKHVVENVLWMEQPQLTGQYLTSDYRNQDEENTFPWVGFQQLPSQVAEQSFPGGESLPPGELGEHVGCNGLYYNSFSPLESTINVEDVAHSGYYVLDQNSFPAQQSPVSPVQRSSSYPGGFSNDCNMLNFHFESTQVDVNSQWAVQDKYRAEENGHIMSPGFNSSKSLSTEANFGYSSDTATQTHGPVDIFQQLLESITSIACMNHS